MPSIYRKSLVFTLMPSPIRKSGMTVSPGFGRALLDPAHFRFSPRPLGRARAGTLHRGERQP